MHDLIWVDNWVFVQGVEANALAATLREARGRPLEAMRPCPADAAGEAAAAVWRNTNWGTRSEAREAEMRHDSEARTVELRFRTAAHPPVALFEHLRAQGFAVRAVFWEPACGRLGHWFDDGTQSDVRDFRRARPAAAFRWFEPDDDDDDDDDDQERDDRATPRQRLDAARARLVRAKRELTEAEGALSRAQENFRSLERRFERAETDFVNSRSIADVLDGRHDDDHYIPTCVWKLLAERVPPAQLVAFAEALARDRPPLAEAQPAG